MEFRLNKFLAEKVGLSRREADNFIAAGKVLINGKPAVLGARVKDTDEIILNGKKVDNSPSKYTYLMLNKPEGYVSSRKAQGDAPTLYELLPDEYKALKTVGRLDKNSSGLILLTNDGDFAFSHTHPKFYKLKTYFVTLDRALEPLHQQEISDFGIHLEDGISKLCLSKLNDERTEWQVEMSEGRNRQIRRTFAALGYEVTKLHRIEFGAYQLGDLKPGKYKLVEKADGSEVTIAELLDMARTSAFNALLKGVQGDEYTRFYLGWLQMNGMGETDFDDATKFTRVGMQVDVSDIFAQRLLIRNGNKQHLASAAEHLGNSASQGTRIEDPLIDQVHRAMLAYEKGDRHILLTLLNNVGADDQNSPFWRLVASLKELLPEGKDLKAIEGLMGNSDNLRQESREVDQHQPEQMSFDFGGDQ